MKHEANDLSTREVSNNRRPHWTVRSLLLWMTIVAAQLALFRLSPFMGAVALVILTPAALMAWFHVVIGVPEERIRIAAAVWSGLLFAGLPALIFLYVNYLEASNPTPVWMALFFLMLIGISGICIAIVHYFLTTAIYRVFSDGTMLIFR